MEQFGDLGLIHTLSQRPHQLGHGGLRGHILALDDAQIQQFVAHLIYPQVRAVIQALGGDHHADAVFHAAADGLEFFTEHIDTAEAEGFDDDTPIS